MTAIFFTVATANYLPLARFLAITLKEHHPDCRSILFLFERSGQAMEEFDEVHTVESALGATVRQLAFRYSLLEAATAIKPLLFEHLLRKFPAADRIVYLDPDIWVISRFEEILACEDSITLTPHHLADEHDDRGVTDNMLRVLQCGTYNLGFLAIRRSDNAKSFLSWWGRRLESFGNVDFSRGLFTDQKWIDLAPAMFDLHILRHPGYNVANWNISHRHLTSTKHGDWLCNGLPLRFLHFSGIRGGRDQRILLRYAGSTNGIHLLRGAYLQALERLGEQEHRRLQWSYDYFASGEPISTYARMAFHRSQALRSRYRDPFTASNEELLALGW